MWRSVRGGCVSVRGGCVEECVVGMCEERVL